jgi:hypothetical protein
MDNEFRNGHSQSAQILCADICQPWKVRRFYAPKQQHNACSVRRTNDRIVSGADDGKKKRDKGDRKMTHERNARARLGEKNAVLVQFNSRLAEAAVGGGSRAIPRETSSNINVFKRCFMLSNLL